MVRKRITLIILLVLSAWGLENQAIAGPWADPGDEQLRHHIQVLADAGIIKAPITTWPIMWGAISRYIDQPDTTGLSDAQLWSLAYVRFAFKQANQKLGLYAYVGARSDPVAIRDFSSDQREKNEVKGQVDWMGNQLAGRLSLTWADNATDNKDFRLDGSYIAGLIGNWSLSAGAIDRWWGPGWQSSLILSDNARPINAVTLQRNFSDPFETPWLSWIGPWTLTMFAGQLESHRAVPDAKLIGARLAFKPLTSLEFGLSRTAQWGGEGRPQSLSSLGDLILAKNEDKYSGPGNQLGSIDIRWGFSVLQTDSAVYVENTGEDASYGFPSKPLRQVGFETAFTAGNIFHRFALEYADSMSAGDRPPRPNVAYEHSIYLSGYRYYNRPLGASFDNDTRAVSLLVDHYFNDGSQLSWKIVKLDINRDGSNVSSTWGGSVYGANETQSTLAQLSYSFVVQNLKVTTSVYNVGDNITWNNENIDGTGAGLALEYKL